MKTTMKLLALCLCLALTALTLAACDAGNPDTSMTESTDIQTAKIGIIQYISHPSLDNCTNGIIKGLTEAGVPKDNITLQIGSDASAGADCDTYAKNMVAQRYDLIFAVATPAATAAAGAVRDTSIPLVFCSVSDPVSAGLVDSLAAPGGNITGTSDVLDLASQVDLIQAMQPDVKKIGVLYTTSEANSITQLQNLRDICTARNIEVVDSGVQGASDIPAAATALVGQVDCLNNFTDNNVVNNLSVVLDAAKSAGIPVYGSEVEQVKNGCLASMSIDYVELGRVTGQMGISVLGGEAAATMAVKTFSEAVPVINSDVVQTLSLTVPEKYASAERVTTTK